MEKTFALKTAIPTLATNGKAAIYSTLDPNVTMILILKEFEWENRKKEEVFRCPRCRCYVFPSDKSKTKDGLKYHQTCTVLKGCPAPACEASEGKPGQEKEEQCLTSKDQNALNT